MSEINLDQKTANEMDAIAEMLKIADKYNLTVEVVKEYGELMQCYGDAELAANHALAEWDLLSMERLTDGKESVPVELDDL